MPGRAPDSPSPLTPLVSEFAHDPDMADIVADFRSELPERARAMEEAWASGQPERLRSLAHQLKGAGGGYGYPSISAAAGRLESALREQGGAAGSMPAGVSGPLGELLTLCRRAAA